MGLWAWIPFTAAGVWLSRYGYETVDQLVECSFYRMTGFPCPGCGGTRALYCLFSGKFIKSFQYHPVVVYGILAYLHFMQRYYLRSYLSGSRDGVSAKEIQVVVYVYIALVLILIQWMVKVFAVRYGLDAFFVV